MNHPSSTNTAIAPRRDLHYYAIPSALNKGRWLVVYNLPGLDAFSAPVQDCPTQDSAVAEADRLNGGIDLRRALAACSAGYQPRAAA